MTKPSPLTIDDFADFEINQLLAGDIRAAKQLVCVVNVIRGEVYYEVIHPGGVHRFDWLSNAIEKYNEV